MSLSYEDAIENVANGLGDPVFIKILADMEHMDMYLRYEKFCELLEGKGDKKNSNDNTVLRKFIHDLFVENDLLSLPEEEEEEGSVDSIEDGVDFSDGDSFPDEYVED